MNSTIDLNATSTTSSASENVSPESYKINFQMYIKEKRISVESRIQNLPKVYLFIHSILMAIFALIEFIILVVGITNGIFFFSELVGLVIFIVASVSTFLLSIFFLSRKYILINFISI